MLKHNSLKSNSYQDLDRVAGVSELSNEAAATMLGGQLPPTFRYTSAPKGLFGMRDFQVLPNPSSVNTVYFGSYPPNELGPVFGRVSSWMTFTDTAIRMFPAIPPLK
ncbi:hypothetical protein F7734_32755 [Scytonema sp. UIC 10036]|uniref:hypothetical protein n=1 Tax=Scytonema sp. UIC 10036 TaxID=2304196 RepID=UPI0012DA4A84|nr:hypothetical protein [Scytonema sp. UIC 10036]MUG96857.1 hypothetical protein [Scytonema sp. UIC 10036]